ncbi:HypC/HybG/HupF family hydrogenase formation chaperone [Candidatus Woesearchaeota archaeon]|nr:HypC/HybG/HupF family hydrogenase formation chaperone [Candidatus Woesearchaeota archaeon]
MLPEVYFMRYAFPCARVLVDFRKTLSEKDYEQMQNAVENDIPLSREYLERVFKLAFERMRTISDDVWNVETIRKYFCEGHEAMLSNDLPPMIKRLCVVRSGKLIRKTKGFFKADLGGGDVRVVAALYKDAKVGDTAMIHYGYAVEKVD